MSPGKLLTDMVDMLTNIVYYFLLFQVKLGQHVDLKVHRYNIYVVIRVLLVHKIQEIYSYALFVC